MDQELDIAAVLDHYGIEWKDRAGEQTISCPVHEDRKPSASLNLSKGLFNCHACGKQGDALTVIMEREGTGYASALEKYESITGVSGKSVRKDLQSRSVRLPPGSGYKPRVNRKLPPGVRKRTDFGA